MTDSNILSDDGSIDFQTLVEEVGMWSEENFGDQPALWPLKGACEEYGELLHSDLKRDQGIRLEDDGVGPDAERDAIGDITIFLSDYVYRMDAEWPLHRERSDDFSKEYCLSRLGWWLTDGYCVATGSEMYPGETARQAEICLRNYCSIKGYDFDRCVYEAWNDEVSDREWDSEIAVSDD